MKLFHTPTSDPILQGADTYRLYGSVPTQIFSHSRYAGRLTSSTEEAAYIVPGSEDCAPTRRDTPGPISNSPTLQTKIRNCLNMPAWRRAYKLEGKICILGKTGRIFINGKLFRPSVDHNNTMKQGILQRTKNLRRMSLIPAHYIPSALYLRHPFEIVYYHAIQDVVAALVWSTSLGISQDLPIIVSDKWTRSKIGSFFLETKIFQNRLIVKQTKTETIKCDKLIVLRPPQFDRALLSRIVEQIPELPVCRSIGTRLFLHRKGGTTSQRVCKNITRLQTALEDKGFTSIDPDTLSIPEQKYVFSRAEHIVCENGSALTNIIFRNGQPLTIHAIMAAGFATATFSALAQSYGYTFHIHCLPSWTTEKSIHMELDDITIARIINFYS